MSVINVSPGSTDRATIQAALDACGRGGVVALAPGEYNLDGSLFFTSYNSLLTGQYHPEATKLICGGQFPAIIRVPPEYAAVPIDGNALILDGSTNSWLNLSADCWFLNLTGLTPWQCQFDLRLDSFSGPSDERSIIGSQGCETQDAASNRQAFFVSTSNGALTLTWQWDASRHQLVVPSGTLIVGQWHTILVLFDGTNASLSIDGAVLATVAAGPIQQSWHEDVCVGAIPLRWPDSNPSMAAPLGRIRNIAITGNSIYAGATGTTSVALDQCQGIMVPLDTGFGRHWTPYRFSQMGSLAPVNIERLQVQCGTGIHIVNAVDSRINRVTCFQTYNGINLWNNCYRSSITEVNVSSSGTGRIGVGLSNQTVACLVDNFQSAYYKVGVLLNNGNAMVSNALIYGGKMMAGVVVKGDDIQATLMNLGISDEGQTIQPAHGILGSQCRGLSIIGCTGWNTEFPLAPITLHNSKGTTILGETFSVMTSSPGLVKLINNPDVPELISESKVGVSNTVPTYC